MERIKSKAQRTYRLKLNSKDGVKAASTSDTAGDSTDVDFALPAVFDNQQYKQSLINLRDFSYTGGDWVGADDRQGHGEAALTFGGLEAIQYHGGMTKINEIQDPISMIVGVGNHTIRGDFDDSELPKGHYRYIQPDSQVGAGSGSGAMFSFSVIKNPVDATKNTIMPGSIGVEPRCCIVKIGGFSTGREHFGASTRNPAEILQGSS